MKRSRIVVLGSVVAVLAVGAVALWLSLRTTTGHVAMPPDEATPEEVVTAYLAAMNAHDCRTAEELSTQNGIQETSLWCHDVGSLGDRTVHRAVEEDARWSGLPASVEVVDVPVDFDLRWRLFHDDGCFPRAGHRGAIGCGEPARTSLGASSTRDRADGQPPSTTPTGKVWRISAAPIGRSGRAIRRVGHAVGVDEVLSEALAPVWRDLRSTGVHAPRVEVPGWSEDPTYVSAKLWSPDGSGSGVGVSREAPAHERIATAAEQVQDWVIDELWGQGATNWPPCPRHPHSHPMTVRTRDGSAVWMCPSDEVVVAPVGGL